MAKLVIVGADQRQPDATPTPTQLTSLAAVRRNREKGSVEYCKELSKRLRTRMLREMNRHHAVVVTEDAVRLLHLVTQPDGAVRAVAFRSEAELDLIYRNRPLSQYVLHERKGLVWTKGSRVKAWLASRERRLVREVVNAPRPWGAPALPDDVLNVWMGYGCAPAPEGIPRVGGEGYDKDWPKACRLTLEHILDVWCDRDARLFRWVLAWMAQMIQDPEHLTGTFLVVQGGQGCGKGIVINGVLGRILGRGFLQIAEKRHLVGNFNGLLQGRTLIFADELFVRDPEAKNSLKNKVSEPTITVERKGEEPYEIRNTSRIIMATNEPHAIDAEADDRRACVLRASNRRVVPRGAAADHPNRFYFDALGAEVKGEGAPAFFRFLLGLDVSGVDLRTPPTTPALVQQKLLSLPPLARWWHERLCEGVLSGSQDAAPTDADYEWPTTRTKARIAASFDRFAERQRLGEFKRPTLDQLWHFCTDRKGPVRLTRNGERESTGAREYVYKVPALDEARAAFAEWLAVPLDMMAWGEVADPGEDGGASLEPDTAPVAARHPAAHADELDEAIPF